MMMRSNATVNTAQEEYKYCLSTRPLCTQNSPSTLLRFRDKIICREIETISILSVLTKILFRLPAKNTFLSTRHAEQLQHTCGTVLKEMYVVRQE